MKHFSGALAVIGALSLHLSFAVSTAPAHAGLSTVPNPLAKAKTVSVHEEFLAAGKDGKLTQIVSFDVLASKPSAARVTLHWIKDHTRYGLYVGDDKSGHEYNGLTNTYQPTGKFPDGRIRSELRDISSVDLIMNGLTPGKDAKIIILDGKSVLETSSREKLRDPEQFLETTVYANAKTGLPIKKSVNFINNGKSTPSQEFDFEDWKLNAPIDPKQFVFAPPTGSKPYEEPRLLGVGEAVPAFNAQYSDGSAVNLADYKGKIVIIDLWATWCGPCQRSMPHLEKVYEQVKDQNVAVLGVCVWDEKDAFNKWTVAKKGVYTFPVAFDPLGHKQGNIGELFKTPGIPAQFVIGADGKVAANFMGYTDGDHQLEDVLTKLGVKVNSAQ